MHVLRRMGRLAAAWLFMAAGCGLDGGIQPLRSAIEGHVAFTGPWPDSLAEVRVVAYLTYPPAHFTDLVAWSDPLPVDTPEVDYSMPLPPGEYPFVVLAGRYEGSGWVPLAEYNPSGDAVPDTVRIADRTSVVRGVDFTVAFATSGITGRLIFANAWDDTVSSIRVGALAARMTDPLHPPITLQDIQHVSRAFTKDDTDFVYRIELPAGVYRTIGVTWMSYRPDGTPESWTDAGDLFKLLNRPVLGVYSRAGTLVPDSVIVEPGRWVEGIDIVVDFSRVRMRKPAQAGRITAHRMGEEP